MVTAFFIFLLLFLSFTTAWGDRGIIMCAGSRNLKYVGRMWFTLRHVWKTELPVAVAHCDEIDEAAANITFSHTDLRFVNLCNNESIFGHPRKLARSILRGFYCKVGAMVKSPFEETMLMDLDVVWLKKPDMIFSAVGYKNTGTLFMRERFYLRNEQSKLIHENLLKVVSDHGVPVDRISAFRHLKNNGYPSLFWQPYALTDVESRRTHLSDFQDSSIVLVNRAKHPGLLKVLTQFLEQNVAIGYGDKELFWIAATIANESFAFSPYIGAQYRDCYGVLFHYDPTDQPSAKTATPLYINGEFLVERKSEPEINGFLRELEVVGQYLQGAVSKPMRATENIQFFDYDTWRRAQADHKGCTCKYKRVNNDGKIDFEGILDCMPADPIVNQHLVLAQWLTFTATLQPRQYQSQQDQIATAVSDQSVPVLIAHAPTLNRMLSLYLNDSRWCPQFGCADLPVQVDASFPWITNSLGQYYEPVSFSTEINATAFHTAALFSRSPEQVLAANKVSIPVGKSVSCIGCGTKTAYLMGRDGKLHLIPDVETFKHMGLDFADTVHVSHNKFAVFDIGADIISVKPKPPSSMWVKKSPSRQGFSRIGQRGGVK